MGLVQEFKEFAMRGNVLDMAVGIIVGAKFGEIVKSLVDNVLMPPLGRLLGNVDFSDLALPLGGADAEGKPVLLKYGAFLNTLFDFLLVALAVFFVVKLANAARRKKAEEAAAPPAPSAQEKLLAEIRDLLKSR